MRRYCDRKLILIDFLQVIHASVLAFKHDSNTGYSDHYSLFGDESLWFVS